MSQERIAQLEQELKVQKEENAILRSVIGNFFFEYMDVAGKLSKISQLFTDLTSSMNELTTGFTEHIIDKARDVKALSDGMSVKDILKEVSEHFVSQEEAETLAQPTTPDLFTDTGEEHVDLPDHTHVAAEVHGHPLHDADYTQLIDWEIRREEFVKKHAINLEDQQQVNYWMRVFEEANPKPEVVAPFDTPDTPVEATEEKVAEPEPQPFQWEELTLNEASKSNPTYLAETSRDFMELGQALAASEESYDWSKSKMVDGQRIALALVDDRHYFRYSDGLKTYLLKSDPVNGAIDIFSSSIVSDDSDLSFMDATVEDVSKIKGNLQRLFLK